MNFLCKFYFTNKFYFTFPYTTCSVIYYLYLTRRNMSFQNKLDVGSLLSTVIKLNKSIYYGESVNLVRLASFFLRLVYKLSSLV